jgi:hypothetical protein
VFSDVVEASEAPIIIIGDTKTLEEEGDIFFQNVV